MAGPWLHSCRSGERAHRPGGCLSAACGWFKRRSSDLSHSCLLRFEPHWVAPSFWRVHLLKGTVKGCGLNPTNLEEIILNQEIVGYGKLWGSLYTGQSGSVSICSLYVAFIKTKDHRCWFQISLYCFAFYQISCAFYRSLYNNVHIDGISWFFFKIIFCLLGC